jgi:hypothetical protein
MVCRKVEALTEYYWDEENGQMIDRLTSSQSGWASNEMFISIVLKLGFIVAEAQFRESIVAAKLTTTNIFSQYSQILLGRPLLGHQL